jgi:hypothetical protein
MLRPGPAVPIERPPTVEEVIDELRARLTLVALRAQEDRELARVRGPSATGLGLPTLLSSRLSHRTNRDSARNKRTACGRAVARRHMRQPAAT